MKLNIIKRNDINIFQVSSKKYQIELLNIGASIYKLKTLDRNNEMKNIVLTYKSIQEYRNKGLYLGANIGRFAGRIEGGNFMLNQKEYFLEKNEGNISFLHGGSNSFHSKKLKYKILEEKNEMIIKFFGTILEKDDKIPGDINIEIKYILSENNIRIEYYGKSTKDTILNMTNHSYFNLSGNNKNNIKNHIIQGNIHKIWKTNKNNVPVSKHEFNIPKGGVSIKNIINQYYPSILKKEGIDNPFSFEGDIILKNNDRKISFSSSYKNFVLYTQHFKSKQEIINNLKESTFQGLAIEFQNVPNDIEKSILRKNEEYNEYINIRIY